MKTMAEENQARETEEMNEEENVTNTDEANTEETDVEPTSTEETSFIIMYFSRNLSDTEMEELDIDSPNQVDRIYETELFEDEDTAQAFVDDANAIYDIEVIRIIEIDTLGRIL